MVRQRRFSTRFLLAEFSVFIGGVILGCTDQRTGLPTQGPRSDLLADGTALSIGAMNQLLIGLFPDGPLLDSARDQLNNIQPLLAHGDLAGAQSTALHLADFTIKGYRAGELLDPNGTLAPTTPEAIVQLFDALLSFRSEEHTSELQSRLHLVCRLLLEKKKKKNQLIYSCKKS